MNSNDLSPSNKRKCCPTLSLEFGQLHAQRVVAVFQLSLLQLQVLRVFCQRADFGPVLKVEGQEVKLLMNNNNKKNPSTHKNSKH